jgi:decaprenylphospho-beta-D-ribofuranose 2-oxidase
MIWKDCELAGWGRVPRARAEACRPERLGLLQAAIAAAGPRGIIARGGGRSYGDQALNGEGRVLLTGRLDRFLGFDRTSGLLECEPGVTFRHLLEVFLPKGFVFPTAPGTAFATVGGAVANDVHGKNHERAGGFAEHVEWLELALASGEVVRTSPALRPELFRATVGGGGLTGVITRVAFRMRPTPARRIAVSEKRMADLDAFFAAFEAEGSRAEFSVGWIDALARGPALGRGILELGRYATDSGGDPPPPIGASHRLPIDLPSWALNRASVRLFNRVYLGRVPPDGRERLLPLDAFLFPLDAVLDWNRAYGRRGFRQFQCVIPEALARAGIGQLLTVIAQSGAASPLAVLKRLGRAGRGHLSFPLPGYTLALDFPERKGTAPLLGRLEGIVRDHGGRLYLAKDSTLTANGFAAMYPELDAFRAVLAEVDPGGRFQSDQARRLGIRGRPA